MNETLARRHLQQVLAAARAIRARLGLGVVDAHSASDRMTAPLQGDGRLAAKAKSSGISRLVGNQKDL